LLGTNACAGDEDEARMKATQAAERTIDEAVMIGGLNVAGLVLLEDGYCRHSLALMLGRNYAIHCWMGLLFAFAWCHRCLFFTQSHTPPDATYFL